MKVGRCFIIFPHSNCHTIKISSMITNIISWAQGMQKDNFTCLLLPFSKLWPIAKKMLTQDSGGSYYHFTYFTKNCVTGYYHSRYQCSGKYWVSMVSDTSLSYIARDYVLIQLTFFVIYIVLIIRIQVSHGQTSKA